MTARDTVVLRVVQAAAVRATHPAAPVVARVVVREKNVPRFAEPVNNVWTVLVKSGLVQSLLVRIHNNRPEQMNAGVSSDVKIYYRDGKGYCDGCPSGTYEKDNGLWIDCVDCTQDNHCDTANCETCVNNTCQLSCQDGETCDGKGNCCTNGIGNDGNCCPELTSADCETELDENGCTVCAGASSCESSNDCLTGEECVNNFPSEGTPWLFNYCLATDLDSTEECIALDNSYNEIYKDLLYYEYQYGKTCCPSDKPYAIDGECRSTSVTCKESVPSGPNNAKNEPVGNCECQFLRCPGFIWEE